MKMQNLKVYSVLLREAKSYHKTINFKLYAILGLLNELKKN